jgi:O-antigen ligase
MHVMQKLEKWVFYIFVFSVPIQTRLVLATFSEEFNEWTSAFLWGTDILIVLLFILWIIRVLRVSASYDGKLPRRLNFFVGPSDNKNNLSPTHAVATTDIAVIIFVIIAGISIINAEIFQVALFRWIKLLEFIGLYFYIKNAYGKIFSLDGLLKIIIASSVIQAIIGILQSLTQDNLGLKWLGESSVVVGQSGVAVFEVGDKLDLFLRAYGTMPHPNVLAMWLFLGLWSFYFLYLRNDDIKFRSYLFIAYGLMLYGFLLTFSRVTLGMWVLSVALFLTLFLINKKYRQEFKHTYKKMLRLLVITVIIGAVFTVAYLPQVKARIMVSYNEEAVRHRILFAELASDFTKDTPILGLGIGQFVPNLMAVAQSDLNYENLEDEAKYYPIAYLYQPAHNIYLLISSELGISGLAIFLLFVAWSMVLYTQKTNSTNPGSIGIIIIVGSFLIIGIFDHLFWSLQQGGIMFWGLYGILNSR